MSLPEVAADQEIHTLIRSGNFEYVILEARRSGYLLPDMAGLPGDRGKSIPFEQNLEALRTLHRTIVRSGARTVLYMHPGLHSTAHIKHPLGQIYQRFHSNLEQMRIDDKRHEVILIPAMYLWLDALKWFGVKGWYVDEGHGNALARYSSACMLYTYLTGSDPRKNQFKRLTELTPSWNILPEKVNIFAKDEDAKWIKEQVWLYYLTRPR